MSTANRNKCFDLLASKDNNVQFEYDAKKKQYVAYVKFVEWD